jgi:hypothetical protein
MTDPVPSADTAHVPGHDHLSPVKLHAGGAGCHRRSTARGCA